MKVSNVSLPALHISVNSKKPLQLSHRAPKNVIIINSPVILLFTLRLRTTASASLWGLTIIQINT